MSPTYALAWIVFHPGVSGTTADQVVSLEKVAGTPCTWTVVPGVASPATRIVDSSCSDPFAGLVIEIPYSTAGPPAHTSIDVLATFVSPT